MQRDGEVSWMLEIHDGHAFYQLFLCIILEIGELELNETFLELIKMIQPRCR